MKKSWKINNEKDSSKINPSPFLKTSPCLPPKFFPKERVRVRAESHLNFCSFIKDLKFFKKSIKKNCFMKYSERKSVKKFQKITSSCLTIFRHFFNKSTPINRSKAKIQSIFLIFKTSIFSFKKLTKI